jgi:hypothetical protein
MNAEPQKLMYATKKPYGKSKAMNQTALEAAFKQWWEESYGRPAGTHAVMTHAGFAAYILKLLEIPTDER